MLKKIISVVSYFKFHRALENFSYQKFPSEIWLINYNWHWDIAVFTCVDTSYFRLNGGKMFLRIFS